MTCYRVQRENTFGLLPSPWMLFVINMLDKEEDADFQYMLRREENDKLDRTNIWDEHGTNAAAKTIWKCMAAMYKLTMVMWRDYQR